MYWVSKGGKGEKKGGFVSNVSILTAREKAQSIFSLVQYIFVHYLHHDILPYARTPCKAQYTVLDNSKCCYSPDMSPFDNGDKNEQSPAFAEFLEQRGVAWGCGLPHPESR